MVIYNIILDCREKALIDKLNVSGIPIQICSLNIGDIHITKEGDTVPLIIIERKTISDLVSSIKDGRYSDQTRRLSDFEGVYNRNIYYLIEGAPKIGRAHV